MLIRLGAWVAVWADKFGCDECRAKGESHCDEDQKLSGSLGPSESPRWTRLPGEILEGLAAPEGLCVCPLPMVPEWWSELASLTRAYARGITPCSGSLDEQPAGLIDAMHALENAEIAYRDDRRRKEDKHRT